MNSAPATTTDTEWFCACGGGYNRRHATQAACSRCGAHSPLQAVGGPLMAYQRALALSQRADEERRAGG